MNTSDILIKIVNIPKRPKSSGVKNLAKIKFPTNAKNIVPNLWQEDQIREEIVFSFNLLSDIVRLIH